MSVSTLTVALAGGAGALVGALIAQAGAVGLEAYRTRTTDRHRREDAAHAREREAQEQQLSAVGDFLAASWGGSYNAIYSRYRSNRTYEDLLAKMESSRAAEKSALTRMHLTTPSDLLELARSVRSAEDELYSVIVNQGVAVSHEHWVRLKTEQEDARERLVSAWREHVGIDHLRYVAMGRNLQAVDDAATFPE